ncbi:MAG: TolB family protein [Bacillota bacterium]
MRNFRKLLSIQILIIIIFLSGCKKSDSSTDPVGNGSTTLTGKILYERVSDGVHIFDIKKVSDQKLFEGSYPERMPNGKILFVLDYPNRLVSANEDGSSKNILVENDKMYFQVPRVSADGKSVAVQNLFTSTINNINRGTLVYKSDGSLVVKFDNLFHPSWTPDGRLVVSGSYQNVWGPQTTLKEGIYITDKELSSLQRIDPDLSEPLMPSVSPDGKQIAFVNAGHIWVMGIDGTNLRQITKSSSKESYPSWTSDGKYIMFNYYRNASVMAVVPANAQTTIDDQTECYIMTSDDHFLNSGNQIVNY